MVKLWAYDYEEEAGAAILYTNADCTGRSGALLSGHKGTVAGFTKGDMKKNNVPDNTASAVRVPPGYTLDLWQGNNFTQTMERITGDKDSSGKIACQPLKKTSNVVTSAKLWNHRKKDFDELFS